MIFKNRKLIRFFKFVVILLAAVFAINWFMTYRMEGYLRNLLTKAVSDATDGFYVLSYDHLSIGLFNGELKVEGLDLRPDTVLFQHWESKDSLPCSYIEMNVKSIEFKGLNIVWLLDRHNLHFDLFEIDSPVIKITNPIESDRRLQKKKAEESKTLYEMLSPYLNEVSVKKMNLIDADVSFVLKDSLETSRYALLGANFQAHGFFLNERSSESGKLLFCDDFEFVSDNEQTLLSNSQLVLKVGGIRLSTQDSVINIQDIHLSPKYNIIADTLNLPADVYIGTHVKEIEAAGIGFKRKDYLNYLDAVSLTFLGSEIQYVIVDGRKNQRNQDSDHFVDTISRSWSLYGIVSPLLHAVSIQKIGISDAAFQYTKIGKDFRDHYKFDQLDFIANGFHLDSLSDVSNRFMYSMNYRMDISGMQATMNSLNHTLHIERVLLDTENGDFKVTDIQLQPIETRNRYDFIQGSIDSVTISELDYSLYGISAGKLAVDNPNIRYVRNAYRRLPKSSGLEEDTYIEIKDEKNTFDDFVSFVNDLSIKYIRLNRGNFIFDDDQAGEHIRYKLKGLNFYANDFVINENTRNPVFGFFDCSNLGFDFNNFDNYVSDKDYRLQIKRARFSHQAGRLSLKGIKLIPQPETWRKTPTEYYSLDLPSLEIEGLFHKKKKLGITSLNLDSPYIRIVKTGETEVPKRKKEEDKDMISFINNVHVNNIRLNNLRILSEDIRKGDSLFSWMDELSVKQVTWDKKEGNLFAIEKGTVSNWSLDFSNRSLNAESAIKAFELSDMKWKSSGINPFFQLDRMMINSPAIKYELKDYLLKDSTNNGRENKSGSLYSVLGNISDRISVNNFGLIDGSFNYIAENTKSPLEKLNILNLNIEGLRVDNRSETLEMDDFRFEGSNFSFPVDNGFYTLNIGKINLDKQKSEFRVDSIHLLAKHPQMEFAYRHPDHKDWFDVTATSVSMNGLDFDSFISGKTLQAEEMNIQKVMLRNFKNKQIEVEHRLMPMIYEKIQKAPIPIDIRRTKVRDFSVVYEELANNKTIPGVLSFIGMNGDITGLTNIVRHPDQYIRLDANGRFMGENTFTAIWMIPVDSLHDCFYLGGHLERFDLLDLNKVIEPLANVRLEKGIAKDTRFDFEASSLNARINMRFLYNDLKINILKGEDENNMSTDKFVTGLANLVISSNNPRNSRAKPKTVNVQLDRDPYHSTFNYFWQILQPALGESVGVSQRTQNFGKKVANFFNGIKNFFSGGNKDKEKEESK